MKWWGNLLVIAALVFTAVAIFVLFVNAGLIAKAWFGGCAISLWLILIIVYLSSISELKRKLDELIVGGERIKSRQTDKTEASIDRYDSMMTDWDGKVDKVLKGTEWEKSYKFTTGFTKPENESSQDYLENFLVIGRNYMALRLTKLKEIRDSL